MIRIDRCKYFHAVQAVSSYTLSLTLCHDLVHRQFLIQIEIFILQIREHIQKISSHTRDKSDRQENDKHKHYQAA